MPQREKETKPKTLKVDGRKGDGNFGEGRAAARGAGRRGRAGSEGGVGAPGDLGSIPPGQTGVGVEVEVGDTRCFPGLPSRPRKAEGVCEGWGPGKGTWGAGDRR